MSRLGLISTLSKLDSLFDEFKIFYGGLFWWIHNLLLPKFLFLINIQKYR